MANRQYGYQGIGRGYQYETSPRKIQPDYDSEPKKNVKNNVVKEKKDVKQYKTEEKRKAVHKQKISKEEFMKIASICTYIFLGFAAVFTISYRNSIINEKFNEKEKLKSELIGIQKQNEQLKVSVENELNLTSIEKIAKESLGMSKLNNNQKVYISLPKTEYVETQNYSDKDNSSGIEKIINEIKEFFN